MGFVLRLPGRGVPWRPGETPCQQSLTATESAGKSGPLSVYAIPMPFFLAVSKYSSVLVTSPMTLPSSRSSSRVSMTRCI